ncbi:hypothetical protein TFKS16_2704 [Tannerella forsythia KS16]|uniref:Uncharacterized protein n=1 Tax=Tannerella forsythia (strain ATCC 43037 / JCM 10827 / CCUG 21028 A / KCTC 5666 / FDC 338) TaxID=203275 RepID=G8UPR2_TANFA|nr:hypothetical protein BFO_2984 [Tannerella forsythia 92A2]BAR50053.1 hypothetical protein TF3313_2624 [Tannerella forsythia 3313]BAR52882.1 hypothetical protein TFKS16_2704 [Tannerella forsythia KS16]
MYICSINCKEHLNNPKSFRALTGWVSICFFHLLFCFGTDHNDYLSEYDKKMNNTMYSFPVLCSLCQK